MAKTTADGRKEALATLRAQYFDELEKSLKVAIEIRDDPEAVNKDRNEANKFIARLLDALAPEKVPTGEEARAKLPKKHIEKPVLSPELRERLAGLAPKPV